MKYRPQILKMLAEEVAKDHPPTHRVDRNPPVPVYASMRAWVIIGGPVSPPQLGSRGSTQRHAANNEPPRVPTSYGGAK